MSFGLGCSSQRLEELVSDVWRMTSLGVAGLLFIIYFLFIVFFGLFAFVCV